MLDTVLAPQTHPRRWLGSDPYKPTSSKVLLTFNPSTSPGGMGRMTAPSDHLVPLSPDSPRTGAPYSRKLPSSAADQGGHTETVATWHAAPVNGQESPLPPGAGRLPPPAANDRFVKVIGARPSNARPAVALDADEGTGHRDAATDLEADRKFLLVGWMGEQETKAQAHLYNLGLLALALNRTLVLPNVRRSRFGTCYQKPFSLYYAEDSLSTFGLPYISSADFWAWTERQRSAPSAQVITFHRGDPNPRPQVMSLSHMCLDARPLDFSQHEPLSFFSPATDWKSQETRDRVGTQVVTTLLPSADEVVNKADAASSPAVLVAQMNLRYPFLTPDLAQSLSPFTFPKPAPYSYFPYSSHWTSLGHSIAANLSPFVAVHWRTETLAVDRLAPCGDALVSQLREIRRAHREIKTLYLATDYPLEVLRDGGAASQVTAHSGTMTKTLTPARHEAMKHFLEALEGEGGAGMRLTTALDEAKNVEWPEELRGVAAAGLEALDGAIVGIVDKVVLMEAELFYAGRTRPSVGVCGKMSQFTTQVVAGRRDALSAARSAGQPTALLNEVGHFGLGGGKRPLR
ncbi:hypothetical protein JCM10213v2_004310 [Rhodosporidiobolus nylandii]